MLAPTPFLIYYANNMKNDKGEKSFRATRRSLFPTKKIEGKLMIFTCF